MMRKIGIWTVWLILITGMMAFSGCPSVSGGVTPTPADENNNDDLDTNATWQDNFYGTTVDSSKWRVDYYQEGGFGNLERQVYRAQNAYLENGKLVIKVEKVGSTYFSARLDTLGKQTFQYGKIEARIKIPKGNAIWPAFWMIGSMGSSDYITPTTVDTSAGSYTGWPYCGEIDVMEFHGNAPTSVHGTLHWNENPSAYDHAQYGLSKTISDASLDYHIYRLDWDASMIRISVDRTQYFQMDISGANKSEFRQPFFAILNVAIGTSSTPFFSGYPTTLDSDFPKYMYVDWVRYYAP